MFIWCLFSMWNIKPGESRHHPDIGSWKFLGAYSSTDKARAAIRDFDDRIQHYDKAWSSNNGMMYTVEADSLMYLTGKPVHHAFRWVRVEVDRIKGE